jgi:hypothetical protein
MLFPTSVQVYVWRMLKEAYNPERLVRTVKDGGKSVMIYEAISWYSAGPKITLNDRITGSDYMDILFNWVQPMVQLFTNNDAIF